MRILTLSNLYPPDAMGGYELAAAQVVDALRARGHEVAVLTAVPRQPVASVSHVHRRLRLVEDRHWVGPEQLGPPPFDALRDAESRWCIASNVHQTITFLEDYCPDVVYVCNLVGLGGLALIACLQHLGVPWVWQLGDCVPSELCRLRGDVVPALAALFSERIRGRYIVVSRQLHDEIAANSVVLGDIVEILPNWITGERPAVPAVMNREPGGCLRVMFAGVVNREKGVHLIVEAADLLARGGHDRVEFHIYGRVADRSLIDLIHTSGVSSRVHLHGPRPHAEILNLYAAHDVCLFPTREREPFGLVPLEAAARGCVPILTRKCGVAEWLVHGVHCLKVARTSIDVADTLRRILEGEIDLAPLARRAASAVWRDFHLDTILPRIERILHDATSAPRPSPRSPADAYRLARLAESLAQTMIRESA